MQKRDDQISDAINVHGSLGKLASEIATRRRSLATIFTQLKDEPSAAVDSAHATAAEREANKHRWLAEEGKASLSGDTNKK